MSDLMNWQPAPGTNPGDGHVINMDAHLSTAHNNAGPGSRIRIGIRRTVMVIAMVKMTTTMKDKMMVMMTIMKKKMTTTTMNTSVITGEQEAGTVAELQLQCLLLHEAEEEGEVEVLEEVEEVEEMSTVMFWELLGIHASFMVEVSLLTPKQWTEVLPALVKAKSETDLLVLVDTHSDYESGELVHSVDKHGIAWTQESSEVLHHHLGPELRKWSMDMRGTKGIILLACGPVFTQPLYFENIKLLVSSFTAHSVQPSVVMPFMLWVAVQVYTNGMPVKLALEKEIANLTLLLNAATRWRPILEVLLSSLQLEFWQLQTQTQLTSNVL
ncbi:uncharacterized protein F5147DRAFT_658156 [Suillus discolor]|uniref:Uncharacterized protein n=1 Tax=Suillus discolor TaxID=1912936 RepID=A0A9P7EU75_9AGAM|nr:uncharacterized protein F5147DRAFT_658156 [Suillus discolor]KAG2090489.1 hypothetical protein F5147DRAFT_658156 [Suillus discolor]